jgi:hypothetical protein
MTKYFEVKNVDKKKCSNCEHFSMTAAHMGECRRNPPQTSLSVKALWNEDKTRIWPLTNWHDWCGEFKKRHSTSLVMVGNRPTIEQNTMRGYFIFLEQHPKLKRKYPDYESWVLSDNKVTMAWRRGWGDHISSEFQ